MRLRPTFSTLDRYLLQQVGGTLISVFAIVMSLMMFEHLPRLLEIVTLSGRKSYVVVQSMLALLPEYAGIGLLFGLYLAIALTIRRLSLRGEFDMVQGIGIPTYRWMRFPALLAIIVSLLMLWNQGWLMPSGERRLSELGRRMETGQFGFDLEPGKFTELGKGTTVRFADVDPRTNELRRVFFQTADMTFTADRGRLGFDLADHILIDFKNGHAFNGRDGQSLTFSEFHFDSGGRDGGNDRGADAAERRKGMALPALLLSNNAADYAVGCSRLLWPGFALLVPFLAVILGKPVRRSSTSLGLMVGLVLLVFFTRTTGFVADTHSARPCLVAVGTAIGWMAAVAAIVWGEHRWGAGYFDKWLLDMIRRLKLGQLRGRRTLRHRASI